MPSIDVSADIDIAASPADVAAVMFDPAREPEWMGGVAQHVEILDAALEPGARVKRTGHVMGKDIAWSTHVETVHFPHMLALSIDAGPFKGRVSYNIQRAGGGSRVRLQTRGDVSGFAFIPAAMIEGPLRPAMEQALGRLKAIVERPS